MDRISGDYVDEDLFGSGKHGFRSGDPLAEPPVLPTRVTKGWLNGVQEELVRTLEAFGLTPNSGNLGQLGALLLGLFKGSTSVPSPETQTIRIPGTAFRGAAAVIESTNNFPNPDFGPACKVATNNATVIVDIGSHLPSGAVIAGIRVRVDPGAVRTGSNRMNAWFTYVTGDSFVLSTSIPHDDGTASVQTIEITDPDIAQTIDRSVGRYFVTVQAGNDAGTNVDWIYYVDVDFLDPGPRNF